ncbi:MAG: glycoside hydrolase family 38 C-terminal domain-containing protein [Candidatus Aminicenantales bacterium]
MSRPRLHLICSAHLDPVWQWRWEEGAAEALATFRNAATFLREHKEFIFNHNEAVLYRCVEKYDPALFAEIRSLVEEGRWSTSGGWYLQPDVNMPGLESLIRQIAEGRRYFWKKFRVRPRVAYNFDSFGHSGGLPQVLKLAGYRMYIHMRPQKEELDLPADLYRWRGVDGSEVLALRIAVGLYHTERDNIEERLREAATLALALDRDVPVFWGLGNHGGGATRLDLERIAAFAAGEKGVEVLQSTPDRLYEALKKVGRKAPVVEGDLQRTFAGCYTSLARVKRKAEESLGTLVQTETLRAASWWMTREDYPHDILSDAWRDHLFNDFHDILTGSCTEPAEKDALDFYGKTLGTVRLLRLGAAAAFNRLLPARPGVSLPITVLNTNPSLTRVPVEVEFMADYRPLWKGKQFLRVLERDGREIPSQEEQPESLLPFNWRKRRCFMAELPGLGAAHFEVKAYPGKRKPRKASLVGPDLNCKIDRRRGLITSLRTRNSGQLLSGPLLEPLVIKDEGDSWGTGCRSYRAVAGRFRLQPGSLKVIEKGPVRTITESVLAYKRSRIVLHTIGYRSWPVIEFRLRIHWQEERKMLKLAVPTVFRRGVLLCEIPGGAIRRPADGQEHVFGRWALVEGADKVSRTALAVIGCGPHGLDFKNGELRLSVLRSAAYCHERGFKLAESPARKFMDQGLHQVRFLVTAGDAKKVRRSASTLADWLASPPFALAHLPFGMIGGGAGSEIEMEQRSRANQGGLEKLSDERETSLLTLSPQNIRLTACKRSWDAKALVLRLHETAGLPTDARLTLRHPLRLISLEFRPFEIKTLRIERTGVWREAGLISET